MGIRHNTYHDNNDGTTTVYGANGCSCLVDTWLVEDLIKPYYWSMKSSKANNYIPRAFIDGKRVCLSRYLMGFPDGIVDHINRDETDNRLENLRICTSKQNLRNTSLYKTNKSGYRGVSKNGNSWSAQITVDCKKIYLGAYDTPQLAYEAYKEAAKKYFGDFAPDYL